MWSFSIKRVINDADPSAPSPRLTNERRACGRLRASNAESSLGPIQDISATGLRVRCSDKLPVEPGDQFWLEIRVLEQRFKLPVELIRIQQISRREYDLGLCFLETGAGVRDAVNHIARMLRAG